MCGIIGGAGKLGFNEEKACKTLLELDTLRGPHSTGVAFVEPSGEVNVVKQLGTPWDLYTSAIFTSQMRFTNNLFLGHNRFATKGQINRSNAHPFEFDGLVGVHNGTLRKQYLLEDHREFEVDSENIYHHMNKKGVEDTASSLCGAYALVWYDKGAETINFLRNKERPLFYCYTEDRKTIFWASEKWMLYLALEREKIKYQEVQEVKEDHHYSVKIPLGYSTKATPFEKVKVRKVKTYIEPLQKSFGSYTGGYSRPKGNYPTPATQTQGAQKNASPAQTEAMRKLLNKKVEFVPDTMNTPRNSNEYIEGFLSSNIMTSVRCYCFHNKMLWSDLCEAIPIMQKFEGVVKGFNESNGGYLILDSRSITALEIKGTKEETLFPIQGGVMVPGPKFLEKTKQGCAFCSSPVSTEDAIDLVWIDQNDFICEGCIDIPEVKEFLPNKH